MSARFCVLAAVLVASLVSAASTTPANGCPVQSGNTSLYANITSGCSAVVTCTSQYTTCLGSTTNCTKAGECITGYLTCINGAVDSTGCSTLLADLKLSLMSVSSGQLFNASNAYKSCQARGCSLLNDTYSGKGTNCSVDLTTLCVSPVNFVATLLLQGQFTAILNDPVKRAKFLNALVDDLFRALRIAGITVRRAYIAGSKRQALQTLVVEVQVPGVSSSNTAFNAAFTALKSSTSWASSASAVYQAETGSTLTVLSVGAGGASTAFSTIPVPTSAPTTAAPTPKPPTTAPTTKAPTTSAPTTKTPATSNSTATPTTAKPSSNTPAPPTPSTTKTPTTKTPTTHGGSSSSGAGARSLLVAAAIAVMSAAFLF